MDLACSLACGKSFEIPLAAVAVDVPELLRRLGAAADRHAPAADAPEQKLDVALHVAQIGLGEVLAAQEGRKDRHMAVVALERDLEGTVRARKESLGPHAEGDEAPVEQRLVPIIERNTQIVHVNDLAFLWIVLIIP